MAVVAVVSAIDTLGVEQTGKARAVLIVDRRATSAQKAALVKLAQSQGGALLRNVVRVQAADIDLKACPCKSDACAVLNAGVAKIETRCLDEQHDKICGNESPFYPPLAKNVKVKAAVNVDIEATGNITLKATGQVKISGTGGVDIDSPALVNVKGSIININ